MRTAVFAALALLLCSGAAPAAARQQQQIGGWVLDCPDSGACQLRFAKRFLDKGGITGDLEVEQQASALVPVIALRGLSTELLMAGSMAGKTDASIQFGGGATVALPCSVTSAGYICAPSREAGQKLATELMTARSVTVRVAVAVGGMAPLPAQEKRLDLAGTNEALAKLRTAGPSPVPSPLDSVAGATSPEGLMSMADKALKAAGYPGGVADVQALIAKYSNKLPAK